MQLYQADILLEIAIAKFEWTALSFCPLSQDFRVSHIRLPDSVSVCKQTESRL